MESSCPPEGTASDDANYHGEVTDKHVPNCGWKVLPEAPADSGYHLQLCCQCVPPVSGSGGDTVITCVEYSSKFGMLVKYLCVIYLLTYIDTIHK